MHVLSLGDRVRLAPKPRTLTLALSLILNPETRPGPGSDPNLNLGEINPNPKPNPNPNQVGDTRWEMPCPRTEGQKTLTLRDGFRACRTVTRGALGGRTFEFWVEPLQAPNEPGLHGGPLWAGRELKAMGPLRSEGPRIMGRRPGQASTPAALWAALSVHCGSETRVRNPLAWCGLLHPTVQALLDVAAAPLPQPSLDQIAERAAAIGSRRDGLRGLREGGSQLRLIGQIAGEAFLLAMKAISRTEPELVFEQLLQRKEFQLTWLPEDLRKGLSKASMLVHMGAASLGWPGLAGAWPSLSPRWHLYHRVACC